MHIDKQYDYALYDYRLVRKANIAPNEKRAPEIGEVEWVDMNYRPGD